MTSNQLTTISKKLSPIAEQASALRIVDDETLKQGVELLSKLNQFNDRISEEREKVTKPLMEALKAERARWKPTEAQNESAINSLRLEMTRYQTALVNEKKEAEKKIADRVTRGTLKVETAVKKIEAIEDVEKEHATEAGLVQFRETQVLKIIDKSLIPIEYYELNEGLLLKDLKNGLLVPGAITEKIQIPVNYR